MGGPLLNQHDGLEALFESSRLLIIKVLKPLYPLLVSVHGPLPLGGAGFIDYQQGTQQPYSHQKDPVFTSTKNTSQKRNEPGYYRLHYILYHRALQGLLFSAEPFVNCYKENSFHMMAISQFKKKN